MREPDKIMRLLRPKEAAEQLAISERSLWQLTKDHVIPCVKLGRSVRYSPHDLDNAVTALRSQASESGFQDKEVNHG